MAGTVTYVGLIATFNPTDLLAPSTTYTVTVTTGVKDLAGNSLAPTSYGPSQLAPRQLRVLTRSFLAQPATS